MRGMWFLFLVLLVRQLFAVFFRIGSAGKYDGFNRFPSLSNKSFFMDINLHTYIDNQLPMGNTLPCIGKGWLDMEYWFPYTVWEINHL